MEPPVTDATDTTDQSAGAPRSKTLGTFLGIGAFLFALGTALAWFRKANLVAIPEDPTFFAIAFLSAAALGVAALVIGARWFGGIPAVLGIIIGSFLPFTMSINHQAVADGAIAVGDQIPAFRSVDEFGQVFDSATLHDHLLLIKFFRAHW